MTTDYQRIYIIRMMAHRTMKNEPPLHSGPRIDFALRLLSMLVMCLRGWSNRLMERLAGQVFAFDGLLSTTTSY
jgi:hypothetical protein